MTEKYWQRYRQELKGDIYYSDNLLWQNVKKDLSRRDKPKHQLELYSYCRTDNPFIRQIKASPNISLKTVSELICREKACELQYCLSLQKNVAMNRRTKLEFLFLF